MTPLQTITHAPQQQVQLLKGCGGHLQAEGQPSAQQDLLLLAESKALHKERG